MTEAIIQYDNMVQLALLSVVRDVLQNASEQGLPGDHHFYITFSTDHPNTAIPPYLKERYPEEMTIVIQNQFTDLRVEDSFFEISLSFNGKHEHLHVPFPALQGFFDPSVDFGLHFHASDEDMANIEGLAPPVEQEKDLFAADENDKESSGNVVTLDQFRKK